MGDRTTLRAAENQRHKPYIVASGYNKLELDSAFRQWCASYCTVGMNPPTCVCTGSLPHYINANTGVVVCISQRKHGFEHHNAL